MGHFEDEKDSIRDQRDMLMKERMIAREQVQKVAQGHDQARRESLGRALDHLQFLAYLAARSDVPQDHPMGVACLDTVFATIRQLLLPANGESPWQSYG